MIWDNIPVEYKAELLAREQEEIIGEEPEEE